MILCGMLDLCRIILWIVVDLFRPRAAMEAEILVLRQQIIVLRRGRPCPFRKSYPDVVMMQSGQDWNGDNDTGPLDCSMQGRIFL
jgi:hypothetical protein